MSVLQKKRVFFVKINNSKLKVQFVFALNMHYLCGLLCSTHEMKEVKSLYRRAAEYGVPFGIYLSIVSVSFVFIDKVPALSFMIFALLLALPFLTFCIQRQYFVKEYGFTQYSGLWMLGIMVFIFASLIMSLVTYVVVQLARPDWLYEWAQWLIAEGSRSVDSHIRESSLTLKNIVDNNLVPRAIEVVFLGFWFMSFLGSVLSAIMALVVRAIPVKLHTS